jgi:gamma-glutamyltranspeptidase / glutathione hydrolase
MHSRLAAGAVAAPRFHHQHLPDRIEVEAGAFPDRVKAALRSKGHVVFERSPKNLLG